MVKILQTTVIDVLPAINNKKYVYKDIRNYKRVNEKKNHEYLKFIVLIFIFYKIFYFIIKDVL